MDLTQNVKAVQEKISAAAIAAGRDPASVSLCAATKVQTDDAIRAAIAAGIRVCGENRVQELAAHLESDAYAGADQQGQAGGGQGGADPLGGLGAAAPGH